MKKTLINKIGKGIKNSWKILPGGSWYNYHLNNHKEYGVGDLPNEIYLGISGILLFAFLWNGVANNKWKLKDYLKNNQTKETSKINNFIPANTYYIKHQ